MLDFRPSYFGTQQLPGVFLRKFILFSSVLTYYCRVFLWFATKRQMVDKGGAYASPRFPAMRRRLGHRV